MIEPDIFLSYSREDRATARHFADCFAREGFSVWWDTALHSGETFDEVIEAALKASKAVVVLWSPQSVISRWVRSEATLADRRKKLAPVMIEPCDLPLIFELTHTVDLSNWSGSPAEAAWQSLIKDLHRLVQRADQSKGAAAEAAALAAPPSRYPSAHRESIQPPRSRERHVQADIARDAYRNPVRDHGERVSRPWPVEPRNDATDADQTQHYTRVDGIDLLRGDEFHCLELTVEGRVEKRFVVSPLGLRIGRAAPADIVLSDARVSRSHCTVELAGEQLRVLDLNSTNGTFIDGERVTGSALLEVGSVLRVGNVVFKHELRTRANV